jgi:pimeloyl-ACP methyl ester carboxylesterase
VVRHVASDGVRLDVDVDGPADGPTAVLLHGLAGSVAISWRSNAVVPRLTAAGVRVVAFDLRGHGRSDAPHDGACYGDTRMVADLFEMVDAFAGPDAVVVGYSMGANVTLLALEAGLDVRAAVVGAAAPAVLRWSAADEAARAAAIAALDGAGEPDAALAAWLSFLDATGTDRVALARVLEGHRPVVEHWDRITTPVVVVAGADDVMAAPPHDVAARLPNARVVVVPGEHIGAPGTDEFVGTVLDAVQ